HVFQLFIAVVGPTGSYWRIAVPSLSPCGRIIQFVIPVKTGIQKRTIMILRLRERGLVRLGYCPGFPSTRE
ncbi:MAG: hypothetical protein Q7R39_17565, partial [Dehalococcoidia bacterium]|nr:hypothetical protein [Dehalococcoidia bacterium]